MASAHSDDTQTLSNGESTMTPDVIANPLPRIVISRTEERRLMALATVGLQRQPDAAAALLAELERAVIVPDKAVPSNVVRINSIIEFEVDDGRRLKVELVLPEKADIAAGRISVLTPVGAALIGLCPGQSIGWSGNDRMDRVLTVRSVKQPELA
jgi:regulator of nucleoside diphosphate kinase